MTGLKFHFERGLDGSLRLIESDDEEPLSTIMCDDHKEERMEIDWMKCDERT